MDMLKEIAERIQNPRNPRNPKKLGEQENIGNKNNIIKFFNNII